MKKKLTISLISVFLILGVIFAIGAFAKENGIHREKWLKMPKYLKIKNKKTDAESICQT